MPEPHAGMLVTPSVKLVRPLGEGGMGSVWVADHAALRTQVVVKFISSSLKADADVRDRFSREAAAAAQVKSPHVVQTFDHGVTDDGVPYIVMELLEGRDLGAHLRESGKLAPALVLEIVTQLSRALDRAHQRGIVHRDIKPENIFLCEQDRGDVFVKLLDFGIAKGVEIQRLDGNTKTGAMMGSPFYMSPEQILGSRNLDGRSDLWSVGVVAFEALTGMRPFDAETMGGLALKIHNEPLPRPRFIATELPPEIDGWFERACARNAQDRFATGQELAVALAVALGHEPPTSIAQKPPSTSGVARGVPLLVSGAATDAGVVRTGGTKRRNSRALALVAVVFAGVGVGFVGLRVVGKAPSPTTDVATAAQGPSVPVSASSGASPVAPPAVTPLPSIQALAAPPPEVTSAAPATPAGLTRPTSGNTSKGGAKVRTKPASATSPASPAPVNPPVSPVSPVSPSPPPRPSSTSHDIF